MSDIPPLNRLHRAQELYEKDINTPGARHGIPIIFLFRVGDELSEQAAIIRDLRKELEEIKSEV